MVFDRLKSMLGGRVDGPSEPLRQALMPINAVSNPLYDRAVAFVHDGSSPEVLLELDGAHQPELMTFLKYPAQLQSWSRWLPDDVKVRLREAGVSGDPNKTVPNSRSQLYRNTTVTQPQFLRFGYVLAAIGQGPNRQVPGVPKWLTALANDLCMVLDRAALPHLRWPPERFADLLSNDGMAEGDIAATVLLALSEQANIYGSSVVQPHELPGIDNYLLGFGHQIPPQAVLRLSADGRKGIAERVTANPAVGPVLAPIIAQLAIDKAKGVRAAAIAALALLPGDLQTNALRPVLLTAPAAQSAELIEYLSRTQAGGALLDEAVGNGAKLGGAVDKANARREALHASAEVQPLIVPPFVPLPDALDEALAFHQLRSYVDAALNRSQGGQFEWQKQQAQLWRQLTDGDLQQIVRAAQGGPKPKVLQHFNTVQLAQSVPAFNLVHLMRLETNPKRNSVQWLVPHRIEQLTDLRQVDDAVRRTFNTREAFDMVPRLARESSWGTTLDPEVTWPWFAVHLDVLQAWLSGDATDVGDALAVLAGFPTIPPVVLPSVSAVALGTSRRNRPTAQALLARHGAAPTLAAQGLADGKGELRAASAAWLATIGDPAAVPVLRKALAAEKREVPRAAMLAALQQLGDDISADLGPDALLAEAVKGLKAKIPPALDWFGFDQLPALSWADGSSVDPRIGTWWVVLANKLKDPDGSGLLDLYVGRLAPESGEALGRFVLDSWIAQDTRHPDQEQSRAHAAALGPKRYQWAQDTLKRILARPQTDPQYLGWVRENAARPVEQHVRDAYNEHQATYLGSAAAHRGLLALTTRVPGIELAGAVQAYIRSHGARRAQVDALMYPLYANGQPAAVQLLLSISRRFKQASVQATAAALVERLADRRGWTADELADRTIPTAGFDADALLRLDFGSRQFIGRATPAGTIELSTDSGKPIKALPAAREADDDELVKAAKKQLTTSRKELKAVLAQQTARLYEAMCSGRTWTTRDWREFLLEHPLVGQLVSRLVWVENPGPKERLFRPTEDGGLIDIDDESIELADDARIGLAHRVSVGAVASEAWVAHLADYEVAPLFDQFGNALPAIDRNATQVTDLKGHVTDTFSFRGVATKRGYQRGPAEDGAWFDVYTKAFTASGVTAVLEFTGSYVPEENFACATIGLSFLGVRRRSVALNQVPDVLLAECYADYAALAALGPFDPDWERKTGP